jgi:methylthioribose-1-phosphate isomerase
MHSVFWEDNQVKMVDQRLLPGKFEIVGIDTVEGVAAAISEMVVRGAPAIGAAAAYGMALAAYASPAVDRDGLLVDLDAAKHQLDAARPTAVNLSWATGRLLGRALGTVLAQC